MDSYVCIFWCLLDPIWHAIFTTRRTEKKTKLCSRINRVGDIIGPVTDQITHQKISIFPEDDKISSGSWIWGLLFLYTHLTCIISTNKRLKRKQNWKAGLLAGLVGLETPQTNNRSNNTTQKNKHYCFENQTQIFTLHQYDEMHTNNCPTPFQLANPTQLQLVWVGVDFVFPRKKKKEEGTKAEGMPLPYISEL